MKKTLIIAAAGMALLSACSLEPYEITPEESYMRSFIKQFGIIDKDQDWNLAEHQSVTVTVGTSSRVRVYAYIGSTKYIFADYQDVQGTQTLGFDLPEGVEDIIVKVGNTSRNAKVGDALDFSTVDTKTIYSSTGNITITAADYLYLDTEDILEYRDMLPEGIREDGSKNVDKTDFSKNFVYRSTGPFTIYPVYWHTNQTLTLGVYTVVDGQMNEVDVLTADHADDELQYTKSDVNQNTYKFDVESGRLYELYAYGIGDPNQTAINTNTYPSNITDEQWAVIYNVIKDNYGKSINGIELVAFNSNWEKMYGTVTSINHTYVENNWNVTFNITLASDWDMYNWENFPVDRKNDVSNPEEYAGYNKWRSKGITIDIPVGTQFGMYITRNNGSKFYSEAKHNKDMYNGTNACHAGTYRIDSDSGDARLILGFEDWPNTYGDSDMDLNDIIIRVHGSTPTTPTDPEPTIPEIVPDPDDDTDTPFQWIIAAEDLGSTDDFDFNDLVIGVTYTYGQSTATITPLAAGGTLPLYLFYDGTLVGPEFHNWFGNGNIASTTMINTGGISYGPHITPSINVNPNTFSLAKINTAGDISYDDVNMGGFSISVESTESYRITAPQNNSEAPQMILIPGSYADSNGNIVQWEWPRERVNISTAYEGFGNWGQNHNNNTWYTTKTEGKTVSRN